MHIVVVVVIVVVAVVVAAVVLYIHGGNRMDTNRLTLLTRTPSFRVHMLTAFTLRYLSLFWFQILIIFRCTKPEIMSECRFVLLRSEFFFVCFP